MNNFKKGDKVILNKQFFDDISGAEHLYGAVGIIEKQRISISQVKFLATTCTLWSTKYLSYAVPPRLERVTTDEVIL